MRLRILSSTLSILLLLALVGISAIQAQTRGFAERVSLGEEEFAIGLPEDDEGNDESECCPADIGTPIGADDVPFTIDASGRYFVIEDLAVLDGDAITIAANNVTLDGHDHAIAVGGSTGAAVTIAQNSTNVIIRDVRLLGGGAGIRQTAGGGSADVTIENVEVENTASAGIELRSVSQVEILSCQVETVASGPGISILNSGNTEYRGRLIDNTVHDIGGNGIESYNLLGGIIQGNVITLYSRAGAHDGGIYISTGSGSTGGTLIKENTIAESANGAAGIRIRGTSMNVRPDGNLIVQNTIRWINGPGIRVSSNLNQIQGNTIANYGFPDDAGIVIESEHTNDGDWNSLEANLIGLNCYNGCGISFGANTDGNTYRNNVIRNTPGGTVCDSGTNNTDGGGNIP